MPPLARLLVPLLGLAVASCTSVKQITTPDGRQGYAVACSGSVLTWEDCFEQADLFCTGQSYDVYTRPSEESPLIASEPQDLRANPTTNRHMVIVCKGS
jgi:hypothetical protein